MRTINLTTGEPLTLDGDLMTVLEALYKEISAKHELQSTFEDMAREATRKGKLSATDVARATIAGVKEGTFYILTHQNIRPSIEARFADIRESRAPTNMVPKAHA